MHGRRIWALLALTWLVCCGSRGDEELPCDDKNVEDVVASALSAHNKELTEGAQLALYQIIKATKAQNETAQTMSVHFTARESDCKAGEEKTWSECDYLQDSSKELRHCHADALLSDTVEISSHSCSVEPPIVPETHHLCVGCPRNIDVESEDVLESLSYSVHKANDENDHTHHFLLNNIVGATKQVIAGFRYKLHFDMQKSNCSKAEFKELSEECHPDPDENVFINCNSIVDMAPWRHELPETHVSCQPGPILTRFTLRRRPPGWSPLRRFQNFATKRPTIQPTQQPTTESTTKPIKEESSEESQEGKSTSASLTESPNTTAASSLQPSVSHCPSKAWKLFNPPPPPPPPPPRSPSPPPANQPNGGRFTNADLLDLVAPN